MRRADLSKEDEEDTSACGCLSSCRDTMASIFDIEKLLYLIFFSHYRDLRREKLCTNWVMTVSVPFYASVVLLYWFF